MDDNSVIIDTDSSQDTICSICLEQITKDAYTKLLCKHYFHIGCIVAWLSTGNNNCPLCKRTVQNEENLNQLPPPIIELEIEPDEIGRKSYELKSIIGCVLTLIVILYLAQLQNQRE